MLHFNGNTDFFAFVEAVEEFPNSLVKDPSMLDQGWQGVLSRREKYGLAPPTHSVWLDCIYADYFLELDWVDEKLDDRDPRQREERRRHIQSLDEEFFIVIQAFFSDDSKVEVQQLSSLINSHWHHIQISVYGEQPILVAENYNAAQNGSELLYLNNIASTVFLMSISSRKWKRQTSTRQEPQVVGCR